MPGLRQTQIGTLCHTVAVRKAKRRQAWARPLCRSTAAPSSLCSRWAYVVIPASGTSYNRCDDLLQSEQLSSKESCQSAGHEVLCRFPPSLIFSPVANRWMELAAAQTSSCATTSYLSSMQRSPPQRPSPISPCANASPLLSWTKVRHSHRVGCISTAKHQCNSLDIIIAATCSSVAHDGLNILCMPLLAESPMLS